MLPVTFVPGYETIFYTTTIGGSDWKAGAPVKTIPHRTEAVSGFFDMAHGWTTDGDQIYATADGGQSWTDTMPNVSFKDVVQLQFTSPQNGWALTEKGLVKSVDGGRTWTPVNITVTAPPEPGTPYPPAEQAALQFVRALLAHDVGGMKALLRPDRQALAESATVDVRNPQDGKPPAIYGGPYVDTRTATDGERWANFDVYAGLSDGENVTRHRIRLRLQSLDGEHWQVADASIPTMGRSWQYGEDDPHFTSIQMRTPTEGWVAGDRLLRTADGGQTWRDVTSPDPAAGKRFVTLRPSCVSPAEAWAVVSDRNAADGKPIVTAYLTRDGGRTWQGTRLPLAGGPIYGASVTAVDALHAWAMVEPEHGMSSSPGELYATVDGGKSWRLLASVWGDTPGRLPFGGRVQFTTPTTGWLAGNRASTLGDLLYATFDGGLTWKQVNLPELDLSGRYGVGSMPTFDPGARDGVLSLFLTGQAPGAVYLYGTRDGGKTWQKQGTRANWAVPSFRDGRHGWVLENGKLFRTEDGGATWREVAASGQPALQQVQFVTEDLGFGISELGFWRSDNGGQTWRNLNASVK